MFRPLYDEKHRFFEISNLPSKPSRVFQIGLRERLLCERCEQQLASYEDYASRVFFGKAAARPYRNETGLVFSGLEYRRLKLFFMSLLWRFSVTKLRPYRGAELGRHREALRALIRDGDPGDYLTFPCMITALTLDNKHVSDVIVPPLYTRKEGRWVWAFVLTGFLFHFFVSNRRAPAGLHRISWG